MPAHRLIFHLRSKNSPAFSVYSIASGFSSWPVVSFLSGVFLRAGHALSPCSNFVSHVADRASFFCFRFCCRFLVLFYEFVCAEGPFLLADFQLVKPCCSVRCPPPLSGSRRPFLFPVSNSAGRSCVRVPAFYPSMQHRQTTPHKASIFLAL
jgi:hypothetical protein